MDTKKLMSQDTWMLSAERKVLTILRDSDARLSAAVAGEIAATLVRAVNFC